MSVYNTSHFCPPRVFDFHRVGFPELGTITLSSGFHHLLCAAGKLGTDCGSYSSMLGLCQAILMNTRPRFLVHGSGRQGEE